MSAEAYFNGFGSLEGEGGYIIMCGQYGAGSNGLARKKRQI